jgi:hypothetical protein
VPTSSLEAMSWCFSDFPREVLCLRRGRCKQVHLVVAMVLVLCVVPVSSLLSLGDVFYWLVCFMYCSVMVVGVVTMSNYILMQNV